LSIVDCRMAVLTTHPNGSASGWWVGFSFRTPLFPQAGGLF
jgi:hypothetical protein